MLQGTRLRLSELLQYMDRGNSHTNTLAKSMTSEKGRTEATDLFWTTMELDKKSINLPCSSQISFLTVGLQLTRCFPGCDSDMLEQGTWTSRSLKRPMLTHLSPVPKCPCPLVGTWLYTMSSLFSLDFKTCNVVLTTHNCLWGSLTKATISRS